MQVHLSSLSLSPIKICILLLVASVVVDVEIRRSITFMVSLPYPVSILLGKPSQHCLLLPWIVVLHPRIGGIISPASTAIVTIPQKQISRD